jgi:hypothetical protein
VTHTSGAYLRIADFTEYVLVQQHHDGSALLRVFGPFPSLEASDIAKDALREAGVEDGLMVAMPLREVELNDRPAVTT